ncbi:GNAT family N-acetyltransferase [Streptomyces katrae]|uniref:GNAT family N-acetyltransferase n=1 Tax=Streptomyces katrae TaxID=68223 RepID=UPI00068CA798|nr:GNAT family N-acetyltransferase [Streptomyces katrae]
MKLSLTQLSVPPTDAEVDAWTSVLTAAHAADLPGLPVPTRVEIAGRLRVAPTTGRYVHFAADEGVASLLLFTDAGNAHTASLDVLQVRPDARRRGIGTALWHRVREELLAQGRTSVSTLADLGGAGQAFAESLGFENVLPLAWYVQDVRDVATGTAGAEHVLPAGYELLCWEDLVPEAWVAAAAVAHGSMEDAPTGDMDEQTPAWTPQRLHTVQRLVLDRGGRMLMAAAVTPAGEVAAYTSLVLPDPAAPRALQYDTVVVPAHRGRGLGRAVKLRMLGEATARFPALREIATSVADENTPMRAVNAALGYRRERGAGIFQIKL